MVPFPRTTANVTGTLATGLPTPSRTSTDGGEPTADPTVADCVVELLLRIVAAGPAATILSNSSTTQSATVGSAVGSPPSVLVRDGVGNPVASVPVTFAVVLGNGTITGANQTTNTSGIATVGSWTLGSTAGTNTLTATATGSGITGNPVTFTADGTPGPAATLAFVVQP